MGPPPSWVRAWLLRWLRPSCWIALSALQGSSIVMWHRRRWLATAAEACRLMPVEAASETMATSLRPCSLEGGQGGAGGDGGALSTGGLGCGAGAGSGGKAALKGGRRMESGARRERRAGR